MNSICNICGENASKIFAGNILNKYLVNYYQCNSCNFIQTEKPFWLPEAYVSAMTALDVGLLYRNIIFLQKIPPILELFSNDEDSYIDYGGGYGLFVRGMRDKGFNYYLQDLYAENIFAKHFEVSDYAPGKKFVALTAFEVFEHLEDPIEEFKKCFNYQIQ